jgi:hypothetical protein
MLFSGINIFTELLDEKEKQAAVLKEAESILQQDSFYDQEIADRLKNKKVAESALINVPDNNLLFTSKEIRRICIRYRLRFLDSTHFKSEFPYDAIASIKAFEKHTGKKIENFRIVAPHQAFNLEDINKDPLLFAEIGQGKYYLLHKWGKDLAWYRRFLSWPLQSFKTFFIVLAIFCVLLSVSIPVSALNVLNLSSEVYLRIWFAIHCFIGLSGLSLWAGLMFDKTVSSMSWESKYFNF